MLSKIDKNLPLRERGLQAFALRNEIKIQARELMREQELVATLDPPKTLRDVVRDSYKNNYVGDKLWENILKGSQRTNLTVDEKIGIKNNFAQRRSIL